MRRTAVAVLAVSLLASCGLRTNVRPPEDTAPVIPGEVTATRGDQDVVVRWKRADRSVDGHRVDDLAGFVVERRASDTEPWTRVATIDVVDQEKIRRRGNFSWRDPSPAPGVSYRVVAVTADGQEGPPAGPVSAP